MEIAIIVWLYIMGFLGIFLTQAAQHDWAIKPLLSDTISLIGMIFWPITVPLAFVLIGYDMFVMWLWNKKSR